jgi:hypothetical protein
MPPQPANANPKKFSGIEAAAIIGLAAVMDFVQFIGEWVFLGLFPVIGSTVAFVATLGLATGVGTAVGTALGLFVGSIFGFFISTLAGVILSLWFHLKGVRFAGKLGAAAIVEMVPYANSLPGWTIAAAITVSQANGGAIGRLNRETCRYLPLSDRTTCRRFRRNCSRCCRRRGNASPSNSPRRSAE